MLNTAIVGLGRWGQRLVNSVQRDGQPKGEHIRVTHGVTRTPSKAVDFCASHAIELSDDYLAILDEPTLDAVLLATPHSQHASQIAAAAAAGKHVFVEKPLTLDKASAVTAVAACEAAGVVLALGHNRRFLPAMQDLKSMIDGGELGTILHIEGNFSVPGGLDYVPGMWRATGEESPAGGMTGMGVHVTDAMIHLCGEIESVRCQSLRLVLQVDMDDTTSLLCRFANGMSGYMATLTATAHIWRLQVFGTKGWAHMRSQEIMDVCMIGEELKTRRYPATDIERAELEAFAIAAAGGAPYPLSSQDAIHNMAVFDAVLASAANDAERVDVDRSS